MILLYYHGTFIGNSRFDEGFAHEKENKNQSMKILHEFASFSQNYFAYFGAPYCKGHKSQPN